MSDHVPIMSRKDANTMAQLRDRMSYSGCNTLDDISIAMQRAIIGFNLELHVFWKEIDRSKYPTVFYASGRQAQVTALRGATEKDMRMIQSFLLDKGYDVTEVTDQYGPRYVIRWHDQE